MDPRKKKLATTMRALENRAGRPRKGPSNNESLELQGLQMARISVANKDRHFGNLRKPGHVLLTPGQYRLLGARIVVLLKEISELPLLPIHAKIEADPLCETTRLELEYGIALFGYMLEPVDFMTTRYPWKAELTRQQSCWLSSGGCYIEKRTML
jgi:hypothetical protein